MVEAEWKVCGDWHVLGTVKDDKVTLTKRGIFLTSRYFAKLHKGAKLEQKDGKTFLVLPKNWTKDATMRSKGEKKKPAKS